MKKFPFFSALAAAAVFLNGCSTVTPDSAPAALPAVPEQAPEPAVQLALPDEMQKAADGIRETGGLAAVGTGGSKSLDLALNRAKANGRIALAEMLKIRIAALEKAFIEETGLPPESLILAGFNNTAKTIIEQQIAGSVARKLKYEMSGDIFAAYALMELDPAAIAGQLAKEQELFARLQNSKAFDELRREIASYATFRAVQK